MTAKISLEELKNALNPFADIGTDSPQIIETNGENRLIFIRDAQETSIAIENGKIIEHFGEEQIAHATTSSLLASERYADLRSWALKQGMMLRQELGDVSGFIDVYGLMDGNIEELDIAQFDQYLAQSQPAGTTKVMLIDGPAGIGKTQFINRLALERATKYVGNRRALILHVESRGRQLSYVYDLIAFSLQRLRISVAFDQIPILAKYGLVTIAIDGFDELADPNGYNLAWAQVNELVENIRGSGRLILAGRETFIGRERVEGDIKALREGVDPVHSFTLQPPTPAAAMRWLVDRMEAERIPEDFDRFLERGSLALRPFFLSQLSKADLASHLGDSTEGSVLTLLVDSMISRESTKFTAGINSQEQIANITSIDLASFVRSLMIEVARDMADNQTSSISEANLAFIVQLVMPDDLDEAAEFTLINRASYIGFLTNDARPGHFRFFHEKFFEYFLSEAIFVAISKGEMAKFLRKNIFGASFYETYSGVVEVAYARDSSSDYFLNISGLLAESLSFDRGRKNLASIAIASLTFYEGDCFDIADAEMDEVRIVGTAAKANIENCLISQFDVRSADVAELKLTDTTIITLIASSDSLFPVSGFVPQRLVIVAEGAETTLHSAEEIREWLLKHSTNPPEEEVGLIPSDLRDHPAVKLLNRATRMRQYWLRSSDDRFAQKVLEDEHWPILEEILAENELLTVETRPASGPDAKFYHIRNASEILNENRCNPNVVGFYEQLIRRLH